MKQLVFLSFFFLTAIAAPAQKMYVWCPQKISTIPKYNALNNQEISIQLNDNRVLSDKIKDKCSSEEILQGIYNLVRNTYPNAKISRGTGERGKAEEGKIYLEINLTAYYATFTAGVWYATTGYSLKLIDFRKSKLEFSENIEKQKKSFNVGGMSTAKNNLNKSYIEANTALLDFIFTKLQ